MSHAPPQLSLKTLFVFLAMWGLVLAAAAQVRNLVPWVLILSAFYVPFFLLCIQVTRRRVLIASVVILHTAVVLLMPLAFRIFFGSDGFGYIPAIVFIDAPLVLLYNSLQLTPLNTMTISVVLGGMMYAAIAAALFRLRAPKSFSTEKERNV
jgi:hypothetical protein